MHPHRFDALSRFLGTAAPRRNLTRLLAGLTLGRLSVSATQYEGTVLAAEQQCRPYGRPCDPSKSEQCCSGLCSRRTQTCLCTKTAQCPPQSNPCQPIECIESRCRTRNQCNDTPCGDGATCSGGICAQEPECRAAGNRCDDPDQCCSQSCLGSTTFKLCECSSPGMPCLNGQCCPTSRGEVPCIGFYCGGCRGEDQLCDETGGGCCGQLLCQGGTCKPAGPG